uniref:Uncharacterized protein n=1 Tax=Anguilla anguilla TaxID=7936 RepID=A0A0E9WLP8_ANGAN
MYLVTLNTRPGTKLLLHCWWREHHCVLKIKTGVKTVLPLCLFLGKPQHVLNHSMPKRTNSVAVWLQSTP